MSKTLASLRAQIRTNLDEVTQDDWTDTEVDREANAKYMEVYTAVVNTFENYYSTKSTAASVADQQEYSLPSDLYKIKRVELNYNVANTNSIARRAKPIDIDSVLRDLGSSAQGITVYRNPAYYLRGDILGFLPVPTKNGSGAITIWYIRNVTELSESTDAVDLPFVDRYAQIISLGAASVLLRKGQQEEAVANNYEVLFEEAIEKMKRELEDRVADDTKSVIDTIGGDVDFSNYSNL